MNDYLSKPLNRNQLYDVLRHWQQTLASGQASTAVSVEYQAESKSQTLVSGTVSQHLPTVDAWIDHPDMNHQHAVRTDTPIAAIVTEHHDTLAMDELAEPVLDSAIIEALIRDTSHDLFKRLITIFLKESHEHVEQFAECLQQLDFVNAAKHAHAVKSSAGALGATLLQQQCSGLEVECRAVQPDAAQLHVDFQQAHQVAEQSWQALSELLN